MLELHPLVQTSMVSGDGKPHCVALIVVDAVAEKTWAEKHGAPFERAVLERELTESIKARFGSYEVPRKFLFVEDPFTVANGLLTQTMKLKRKQIAARYQAAIAKLY